MEPINITRNQESYLHADFDVIFQNHINEDTISPQQPHIVFLPPLNTPLFVCSLTNQPINQPTNQTKIKYLLVKKKNIILTYSIYEYRLIYLYFMMIY